VTKPEVLILLLLVPLLLLLLFCINDQILQNYFALCGTSHLVNIALCSVSEVHVCEQLDLVI